MLKRTTMFILCFFLVATICGCFSQVEQVSNNITSTEGSISSKTNSFLSYDISSQTQSINFEESSSYSSDESLSYDTNFSSNYESNDSSTESETQETQNGLVAFWDFDEIKNGLVVDKSGLGHSAIVHGLPEIQNIKNGSAINLSQKGQHLSVADSNYFDFGKTQDFSVVARVKWSGLSPESWPCIINRGLMISENAYNYFGFWIDSVNGFPQCGISNTSGNGVINLSAKQALDTNWHTFRIVQRADLFTLYFYIDGVLQATANSISSICNQPLFIGYNGNNGDEGQFLGLIDSIKIYNVAMPVTAEEVSENGLVAFWDFDEITGNQVEDKSGNEHTATVHGSPQIADLTDNKAINLSQVGQHLSVADSDDFDFTATQSFSLVVRMKWSGLSPESWPCIINRGLMIGENAYNYFGFWIDSANSFPQCGISNSSGDGTLNLPAKQALDTNWHTLKIIQRGDKQTLYFFVDEVLQATSNSINSVSNQSLFIGYNGNSGNQGQFLGLIDSIKIYNTALEMKEENVKTVDSMLRASITYKDVNTGEEMELPYRVYYPSDYNANDNRIYPMLFFLHGHGECGTDNNQQIRVLGGPNKLLDDVVASDKCIVVAPQIPCNINNEWTPIHHVWNTGSRSALGEISLAMKSAISLLDRFLNSGKIDNNRVYAAGISMGGYGTWELIVRRSDVFCAAIPLCGAGIPSLASNIKHIAIWAFHGEADDVVPVSETRDMENALKAVGGNIKATYFPGVGHGVWTDAYATEGLVDWLFSQSK